MLMKEYRICMPLSVEEYRIGQLYMISKHSHEQSGNGEGVEVICNEPHAHPQHGPGQYTEKRIHLSSKLPSWISMFVPRIFYITEKAWNFYPYTITEFTCSFVPKFYIRIETKFEDNNGSNLNVFGDTPTPKENVSHLDILSDPIPEKHYKSKEVPSFVCLSPSPIGHAQSNSPCLRQIRSLLRNEVRLRPLVGWLSRKHVNTIHSAGPQHMGVGKDRPGASAGGLAESKPSYNVFLQESGGQL